MVEGREWPEAALEQSQPTPITAAVLLRAMAFVGRSGGMSEGERLAERSLVISRELGDGEGMSQALQVLGVLGLDTRTVPARSRAARRGDRGGAPRAISACGGERQHALGSSRPPPAIWRARGKCSRRLPNCSIACPRRQDPTSPSRRLDACP